jgi:PEP-CTERM motif
VVKIRHLLRVHNIGDKTARVILYNINVLAKSEILTQSIIMKRIIGTSVGMAAVALLFGAIQAQSQSVNFNFSDGTADGWANSGFGGTPVATVSNIGGQNYIFLPLGGFQVGNVGHGADGSDFYNAMAAAAANPAGYNISYNYYIDTSTFVGSTFFQVGTFVNSGSGYYAQDFPATGKELELNGTQLASGQIFQGQVTINMAAVGFAIPPADTFFRLGFIENGNGTGTGVYFSNISVSPAPEPSTFALIGLGAAAAMLMFRRRLA